MNPWGYHTPMDYLEAANSSSSVEELAFLAKASYDFVRLAVARNPSTTPEILRELVPAEYVSWNQQELAGAILENPKTPDETLRSTAIGLRPFLTFGRDTEMAGIAAVKVCDTPHVPIEIIKLLFDATETSPRLRSKVANNCSRKDVLEVLATDPSEAVRARAERALANL